MSEHGRDEFHRLRTSYLRLRAALRDPTTGLYAYSLRFDEIRALIGNRTRVGAIWISVGDRRLIESVYGWEVYDGLLAAAGKYFESSLDFLLPQGSILAVAGVHSDAFTLFVPSGTGGREIDAGSLAMIASALGEGLEDSLSSQDSPASDLSTEVRVGAALLTDNPFHRFERCVYRALDEARTIAERPREAERLTWLSELQRLLRSENVSSVFQPVVDLESGDTVAMEAYSRGPSNTVFALPRVMFSVGREAGVVGELDRVCRHRAIESLAGSAQTPVLFLNTTAESLMDPDWCSAEMLAALERAGLDPSKVVLDVCESEIGPDPMIYQEAIETLKSVGFKISIDDVGSGPRSSLVVEKLRPDFLKFDLTLVRGLGSDQLRRELVRSLVALAERAGAQLVAERIETVEERQSLIDCGARWGQGYLFGSEGVFPFPKGRSGETAP